MSEPRRSVYEEAERRISQINEDVNGSLECVYDRRSSLFQTPNAIIRFLRSTIWRLTHKEVTIVFLFCGVVYSAAFHHHQQPVCAVQNDHGNALLNGNRCILAEADDKPCTADKYCWKIKSTDQFPKECCFPKGQSRNDDSRAHWFFVVGHLGSGVFGDVYDVTDAALKIDKLVDQIVQTETTQLSMRAAFKQQLIECRGLQVDDFDSLNKMMEIIPGETLQVFDSFTSDGSEDRKALKMEKLAIKSVSSHLQQFYMQMGIGETRDEFIASYMFKVLKKSEAIFKAGYFNGDLKPEDIFLKPYGATEEWNPVTRKETLGSRLIITDPKLFKLETLQHNPIKAFTCFGNHKTEYYLQMSQKDDMILTHSDAKTIFENEQVIDILHHGMTFFHNFMEQRKDDSDYNSWRSAVKDLVYTRDNKKTALKKIQETLEQQTTALGTDLFKRMLNLYRSSLQTAYPKDPEFKDVKPLTFKALYQQIETWNPTFHALLTLSYIQESSNTNAKDLDGKILSLYDWNTQRRDPFPLRLATEVYSRGVKEVEAGSCLAEVGSVSCRLKFRGNEDEYLAYNEKTKLVSRVKEDKCEDNTHQCEWKLSLEGEVKPKVEPEAGCTCTIL